MELTIIAHFQILFK